MISLIAAMAKNKTIGKNNQLPWHYPEDMKKFRELTLGKVIVMGKNTYDSIGKPLPKRMNLVVSKTMKQPEESPASLLVFKDIDSVLDAANTLIKQFQLPNEIMIIGGASIYKQTIDIADKLYLTEIDKDYEGDTFFPEVELSKWSLETIEQKEEFAFKTYTRIKSD